MADDKSKLQLIDNTRIYASKNTEYLAKDMQNTKHDIFEYAKEIYKNPKEIYEIVNRLEMGDAQTGDRARETSSSLTKEPESFGKFRGQWFSSTVTTENQEKLEALGSKLTRFGDLVTANSHYEDLWQRAVEARKAKPAQLDEKIEGLQRAREFSDTVRDTRIKDREWSPYDESNKYLDKGLQMTPEEREKARQMSLDRGEQDPFSL